MRADFRGLGRGLLLALFCFRLGLIGRGLGQRLLGGCEFGIGAGLGQLQLLQRRRSRCRLAGRCRCRLLGLIGRCGGLCRIAGERLGLCRSRADELRGSV